MRELLGLYVSLFSSTGFSIIALSFTFSLLLLPLQNAGRRIEQRISAKQKVVEAEVGTLGDSLKGEQLFLETERIYQRNGYHPIQSVGMGASFFVMLPVLVSAIILFTSNDEVLSAKSFLFINDLSQPDALLGPVNGLPLLMSAITIVDANLRFRDDRKSQFRFYFIAFVLLILVYNLPAGLVLYWTASNIMSLITSRIGLK